ncbi:Ca2+/Na+ antiporter [Archaeoglobus sulfaticallidus PM70-1]|uniref:Ca2+/Na+ antiporter n=1 Tax=Archaeoglobus sulfaticallidus PM70-1 TaxID=387631 RepID=N0BE94_9EURY|nr:sodium:calcium antiporter [Archaeoglobus sulfaticallidus]AGK60542.1 Ca2+/Na+ antiporter [Archaeoglobus sulfaticallidus PM70-1]
MPPMPIMLEPVFEILIEIFVVFIAALLFVNAIEYLGSLFELGGSFVGAILSPLFTSLPEMIVFLVAIFFSGVESGEAIGVGTVFGQPFMASSLSYGLVGISVLLGYHLKRRDDLVLEVDRELVIPYAVVSIAFPLTLVPAFLGFHKLFGILFFLIYVSYIFTMYKNGMGETLESAEEPYACRVIPNQKAGGIIQLISSVILLYYGSHGLVSSVDEVSRMLNISPLGLALIIIPAATAIPETASALIWSFRGRDSLSIASLIGEKILYSTFYPAMGLLLTSWTLDVHAYMSVIGTTAISLILLYFVAKQRVPWWGLIVGFVFFIVYSVLIFIYHI